MSSILLGLPPSISSGFLEVPKLSTPSMYLSFILECFSTLGSGLKNISSGRKKKEMGKILKSNRSSDILSMIDQFNLWPFIAPNTTQKITQLTPKEILTQI